MTDAEIIEYLRTLVHSVDEAITSIVSNDPPKAKAILREVQAGLDDIAQQLRRRDPLDETQH